jgi:hypothetical protein
MADGITTLAVPNWATSTGGAAGSAESTLTLGIDRLDVRAPVDTTRLWGLALNNLKSTVVGITTTFKGGTRLGCLPQSSNPFGASESGCYIDTSGAFWTVFNGTRSKPPNEAVVANTTALTSGLAAQVGTNGHAVTQSTNQYWITYDATNWTALS